MERKQRREEGLSRRPPACFSTARHVTRHLGISLTFPVQLTASSCQTNQTGCSRKFECHFYTAGAFQPAAWRAARNQRRSSAGGGRSCMPWKQAASWPSMRPQRSRQIPSSLDGASAMDDSGSNEDAQHARGLVGLQACRASMRNQPLIATTTWANCKLNYRPLTCPTLDPPGRASLPLGASARAGTPAASPCNRLHLRFMLEHWHQMPSRRTPGRQWCRPWLSIRIRQPTAPLNQQPGSCKPLACTSFLSRPEVVLDSSWRTCGEGGREGQVWAVGHCKRGAGDDEGGRGRKKGTC